jgi:hypothetical protein
VLLVAGTLAAVWLISGVPVGDIARFVAFEALYVLLPGCALYLLLSGDGPLGGRRSRKIGDFQPNPRASARWLTVLAIGWPLGYALEIGVFALTAGAHARGAFTLLPALAALALGARAIRGRRRAGTPPGPTPIPPGPTPIPPGPTPGRLDNGVGDLCAHAAALSDAVVAAGAGGSEVVASAGGPGVSARDSEAGHDVAPLVAALALALAFVLLAVRYFAIYPLPEHANSAFYFLDNVEDLSLSAEALHHWPITMPFLAGHPFRYYIGLFVHVAAVTQVTGVPIAVTFFRLLPATLTLVVVLQFWCLGGLLSPSRWAGPLTVALLIAVENVKLYPTHTKALGVALFSEFTWSPTYGLGVVFFLGLLILLQTHLLRAPRAVRSRSSMPAGAAGALAMLGVLVLGGGAAKTPAVACFIGGVGLLWLWRLLTGRTDRLLFGALGLSLACFAAIYLLLLSGSSTPTSGETELAPLNFLKYTVFASTLAHHPGLLPLILAGAVMCAWKLLPTLGVLGPLSMRNAWSPYASLALATFLFGFVVYALMGSPNGNEAYFVWFGYIAIIPLAAACLALLWDELAHDARRMLTRAGAAMLAIGAASAGAMQASGTPSGAARDLWYGTTLVVVGGLVALWSARLGRRLAPAASAALGSAAPVSYAAPVSSTAPASSAAPVSYAAPASSAPPASSAASVSSAPPASSTAPASSVPAPATNAVAKAGGSFARRVLAPRADLARATVCGVLLIAALGCGESLALAVPGAWRTMLDRQSVPRNSASQPGITAALYRGLTWVRAHTSVCDVLAANTHDIVPAGGGRAQPDSGYFYYSAFAERRVLIEAWVPTARGQHGEQPYPALYALNNAATAHASAMAVRTIARLGVSYILIDKTHGPDVQEPTSVSRLVFTNSALDVYRVTAPVGPHGC